jgi:thiol:disulfide interchange protein
MYHKTFFKLPAVSLFIVYFFQVFFGSSCTDNSVSNNLNAQIFNPVKWEVSSKYLQDDEFEIIFSAKIDKGWHLYSQDIPDGVPIPTLFTFEKADAYKLIGKVAEPKAIKEFDKNFDMTLKYFSDKAIFKQKIKVTGQNDFTLKCAVEFMVCDDEKCLPPDEIEFSVKILGSKAVLKDAGLAQNIIEVDEVKVDKPEVDTLVNIISARQIIPELPNVNLDNPVENCGDQQEISNVWLVFLFGFIGGLFALLTPCVFPMIPLTVSFFTKGNQSQSKGLYRASLYGFFIFMIYAMLSIPFHFNTDPEVLNEIATSVWLNMLFFIVFLVFAISFFGYFEITLPSSLANKTDSASRIGGVVGIFFMALTLALVSFSCTGPILGAVLGSSLKNGPWPITAAMSGFGVALGLPFALFAAFPSVMKKLPKSGSWLNSVKVVLGFIELALAVKFLSNADLVLQWGLIKRETFFLIWTLIGIGLVLYLLGLIKFPHDAPSSKKFSLTKKVFIGSIIAFTIYLAPGVMEKPLWNHNLLSGFPPPQFYSWYEKDTFHAEYTDFEAAIAEAKRSNKPLLIDFTGWACVNCRKMEESVWTVDQVKEILENDFILVSLYVDDKVKLPDSLQGVFNQTIDGEIVPKKIKSIGNKWATFQTHVFRNNSQPYYVILSPEGYLLSNPVGYTPDENEYLDWLHCGINAFKKNNQENAQLTDKKPY